MNKSIILSMLLIATNLLQAQVTQKVVVEHFTNTRCGICASRNPSFYTNLKAQSKGNVLHLAIHPSSPYSACLLNQHNKAENDARTNYYGIYGSTPRLVIQGNVISTSSDYGNAAIFNPYLNQTSPIGISVQIELLPTDSIEVLVSVKTFATHSLGELQLFTAMVEEKLNYAAPNGENEHFDVFRKNVFPMNGLTFTPSLVVGDSVVLKGKVVKNVTWVLAQMYALAIVQAADKKIIQAERSALLASSTGVNDYKPLRANVFPNPVSDFLKIELANVNQASLSIYDLTGREVKRQEIQETGLVDLSGLTAGFYQLVLNNNDYRLTKKIIINR